MRIQDIKPLHPQKEPLVVRPLRRALTEYDALSEVQVEGEPPLWFNIIQKGISAGRKFYFASGGNRIWDLYTQRSAGSETVVLRLEHVKRKKNGQPDRQTYTIWQKDYNEWTLVKHGDGHTLTMVQNVRKPVNEGADEPTVISMARKILASDEPLFFMNVAGKIHRVHDIHTGFSVSGKQAWWFIDGKRNAVSWKVGDTISKLTIKKMPMDAGASMQWTLYDRTRTIKESVDTPMVVRLINQRIAKKGAVYVDVPVLPAPRRLKGWVTEPVEAEPAVDGFTGSARTLYKLKTADHHSGARGKSMWLTHEADRTYTFKTETDGTGNKVLKLVALSEYPRVGKQDEAS